MSRPVNRRKIKRERDRAMFGETGALDVSSLVITHWPGHPNVYLGLETLGYVSLSGPQVRAFIAQLEGELAEAERQSS